MAKPSVGSSFAKKQAAELLRQNEKLGRSWRVIAREDFGNQIKHRTLWRFVMSGGTWVPKDKHLQEVLHITHPQMVRLRAKIIIEVTEDELRAALENHTNAIQSLTSNGLLEMEQAAS